MCIIEEVPKGRTGISGIIDGHQIHGKRWVMVGASIA
jgi:hypothetical protein